MNEHSILFTSSSCHLKINLFSFSPIFSYFYLILLQRNNNKNIERLKEEKKYVVVKRIREWKAPLRIEISFDLLILWFKSNFWILKCFLFSIKLHHIMTSTSWRMVSMRKNRTKMDSKMLNTHNFVYVHKKLHPIQEFNKRRIFQLFYYC